LSADNGNRAWNGDLRQACTAPEFVSC
jgi:hypothetical protein